MKIVNRKEFLSLPSGIIYSYYRAHGFDGLYEKGESLENDWYYADMIDNVDCNSSNERDSIIFAAEEGAHFRMDLDCGSRDGVFEDSDMFAVYDANDLDRIIKKLSAIAGSYPPI